MTFLTVSNENIIFKTQGTRFGVIISASTFTYMFHMVVKHETQTVS